MFQNESPKTEKALIAQIQHVLSHKEVLVKRDDLEKDFPLEVPTSVNQFLAKQNQIIQRQDEKYHNHEKGAKDLSRSALQGMCTIPVDHIYKCAGFPTLKEFEHGGDIFDDYEYKCTGMSNEADPGEIARLGVSKIHPDAADWFTPSWYAIQKDRFQKHNMKTTNLPKVMIRLKKGEKMEHTNAYPMSQDKKEACQKIISRMIDEQKLEHSNADGSCSIIMVKKSGTNADESPKYRLITDLRQLNEKCEKTNKPMANITTIFDDIADGTCTSLFDLTDGFFQQFIEECCRDLTTITTLDGKYRFTVLPQGFCNAPGEFSTAIGQLMDLAKIAGLIPKATKQFVDDLMVNAKNIRECFKYTNQVLDFLWDNGLQINPDKCTFGGTRVKFLGYEFSKNGRSINEQMMDGIQEKMQEILLDAINNREEAKPKNWVQRILGIFGYFKHFIRDYSSKTLFLTAKLQKNDPAHCTEQDRRKIFGLLQQLKQSGYIQSVNSEAETKIYTDASGIGTGYIANQTKDKKECIVAMNYRKFAGAEANGSATGRELAAIVHAVNDLWARINWERVTIYTDHLPLIQCLKNPIGIQDPYNKLARQMAKVNVLNCSIVYIARKENHIADSLSRSGWMNDSNSAKKAVMCKDDFEIGLPFHTKQISVVQGVCGLQAITEQYNNFARNCTEVLKWELDMLQIYRDEFMDAWVTNVLKARTGRDLVDRRSLLLMGGDVEEKPGPVPQYPTTTNECWQRSIQQRQWCTFVWATAMLQMLAVLIHRGCLIYLKYQRRERLSKQTFGGEISAVVKEVKPKSILKKSKTKATQVEKLKFKPNEERTKIEDRLDFLELCEEHNSKEYLQLSPLTDKTKQDDALDQLEQEEIRRNNIDFKDKLKGTYAELKEEEDQKKRIIELQNQRNNSYNNRRNRAKKLEEKAYIRNGPRGVKKRNSTNKAILVISLMICIQAAQAVVIPPGHIHEESINYARPIWLCQLKDVNFQEGKIGRVTIDNHTVVWAEETKIFAIPIIKDTELYSLDATTGRKTIRKNYITEQYLIIECTDGDDLVTTPTYSIMGKATTNTPMNLLTYDVMRPPDRKDCYMETAITVMNPYIKKYDFSNWYLNGIGRWRIQKPFLAPYSRTYSEIALPQSVIFVEYKKDTNSANRQTDVEGRYTLKHKYLSNTWSNAIPGSTRLAKLLTVKGPLFLKRDIPMVPVKRITTNKIYQDSDIYECENKPYRQTLQKTIIQPAKIYEVKSIDRTYIGLTVPRKVKEQNWQLRERMIYNQEILDKVEREKTADTIVELDTYYITAKEKKLPGLEGRHKYTSAQWETYKEKSWRHFYPDALRPGREKYQETYRSANDLAHDPPIKFAKQAYMKVIDMAKEAGLPKYETYWYGLRYERGILRLYKVQQEAYLNKVVGWFKGNEDEITTYLCVLDKERTAWKTGHAADYSLEELVNLMTLDENGKQTPEVKIAKRIRDQAGLSDPILTICNHKVYDLKGLKTAIKPFRIKRRGEYDWMKQSKITSKLGSNNMESVDFESTIHSKNNAKLTEIIFEKEETSIGKPRGMLSNNNMAVQLVDYLVKTISLALNVSLPMATLMTSQIYSIVKDAPIKGRMVLTDEGQWILGRNRSIGKFPKRIWYKYNKSDTKTLVKEGTWKIVIPTDKYIFKTTKDKGILVKQPKEEMISLLHHIKDVNVQVVQDTVSWGDEIHGIYEYHKDKYIITESGRILWLGTTTFPTNLKDLGLQGQYDILDALKQADVISQVLRQKIAKLPPQIGRQRHKNILKITTQNVKNEYKCRTRRDVSVYLNRTLLTDPLPYIPVLKNLSTPILQIVRSQEETARYVYDQFQDHRKWKKSVRNEEVNKTAFFLQKVDLLVQKRLLSMNDIRQNFWILFLAKEYEILELKWIKSSIFKLDQDNQVIESHLFPDPPSISDYIFENKLYSYSPYGNTVTSIDAIEKLQSFKYKVSVSQQKLQEKAKANFNPWINYERSFQRVDQLMDNIIKYVDQSFDTIKVRLSGMDLRMDGFDEEFVKVNERIDKVEVAIEIIKEDIKDLRKRKKPSFPDWMNAIGEDIVDIAGGAKDAIFEGIDKIGDNAVKVAKGVGGVLAKLAVPLMIGGAVIRRVLLLFAGIYLLRNSSNESQGRLHTNAVIEIEFSEVAKVARNRVRGWIYLARTTNRKRLLVMLIIFVILVVIAAIGIEALIAISSAKNTTVKVVSITVIALLTLSMYIVIVINEGSKRELDRSIPAVKQAQDYYTPKINALLLSNGNTT